MLSLAIFLPLIGALGLLLLPAHRAARARWVAIACAGLTLLLTGVLAAGFRPAVGHQFVDSLPWIPDLGVGYRVGLDGLSLPLFLLAALLFFAALLASWDEPRRPKEYFAWFLFLESACLGLFAAMDLFLFYVFWDLALVAMYFIIAIWGQREAKAAALRFFLYTFVGSMALLLGVIGLYLGVEPMTMDMAALARRPELEGWLASLVFFALLLGFGIKLPVLPFHTWMPAAHTEAPSPGSAVLAGVMLKMGGYGLLRVLLPMLPETSRHYAWLLLALGVAGVIYGALVALAQRDLKRMIAYTSLSHMGYVLIALGAAAWAGGAATQLRQMALNGALLQMVAHGLITGSLFLLCGMLWRRTQSLAFDDLGGLALIMPVFAGLLALCAFAALGLPGLAGFVAEFQILVGSFAIAPLAAVLALPGVALLAAVFLRALQQVLMGGLSERWGRLADLRGPELAAVLPLVVLILLVGLAPAWVLRIIGDGTAPVVAQLADEHAA